MQFSSALTNVPADWTVRDLASTAMQDKDGFTDGDWVESPYITDEGIRLVQTGNIGQGEFLDHPDRRKYISESSFHELNCKWVYPGDMLICRLADPVGRTCRVPPEVGPCVTAVDCTIYRPDPDIVDPAFAIHLLNWDEQLKHVEELAGGTTRKRISRSNLGNVPLLLPPLREQRRIAEILDTVDEAIRKTEKLIAKLKQIKAGLLHDLLTRGLDEEGRLRDPEAHPEEFRETELGRLPREWEICAIEEKLQRIIDYRGRTPDKTSTGVPLITAKNVRDGFLDPEPREYIAEEAYGEWMTRGIPSEGDVLFTTEAPLGNVAHVPSHKIALAQRLLTLCPCPEALDAGYLFWLLLWPNSKRRLREKSTGSTVLGIKQSVFRKVPFQFPPVQEQRRISAALEAQDDRMRAEQAYRDKLTKLKKGLMQDLLTGRVRVTDAAVDGVAV